MTIIVTHTCLHLKTAPNRYGFTHVYLVDVNLSEIFYEILSL